MTAARTSPVRVRLLLAKFWDEDETPTIVSAVDQSVWEHWEQADEDRWRDDAKRSWGLDPSDYEWREVWADFNPAALRAAFQTPAVEGVIADAAGEERSAASRQNKGPAEAGPLSTKPKGP